jgi:hypothetical protein
MPPGVSRFQEYKAAWRRQTCAGECSLEAIGMELHFGGGLSKLRGNQPWQGPPMVGWSRGGIATAVRSSSDHFVLRIKASSCFPVEAPERLRL